MARSSFIVVLRGTIVFFSYRYTAVECSLIEKPGHYDSLTGCVKRTFLAYPGQEGNIQKRNLGTDINI